jgi:hypothetical protein
VKITTPLRLSEMLSSFFTIDMEENIQNSPITIISQVCFHLRRAANDDDSSSAEEKLRNEIKKKQQRFPVKPKTINFRQNT